MCHWLILIDIDWLNQGTDTNIYWQIYYCWNKEYYCEATVFKNIGRNVQQHDIRSCRWGKKTRPTHRYPVDVEYCLVLACIQDHFHHVWMTTSLYPTTLMTVQVFSLYEEMTLFIERWSQQICWWFVWTSSIHLLCCILYAIIFARM